MIQLYLWDGQLIPAHVRFQLAYRRRLARERYWRECAREQARRDAAKQAKEARNRPQRR